MQYITVTYKHVEWFFIIVKPDRWAISPWHQTLNTVVRWWDHCCHYQTSQHTEYHTDELYQWQTLTSDAVHSCPVIRPLLSLPDKSTHRVPYRWAVSVTDLDIRCCTQLSSDETVVVITRQVNTQSTIARLHTHTTISPSISHSLWDHINHAVNPLL